MVNRVIKLVLAIACLALVLPLTIGVPALGNELPLAGVPPFRAIYSVGQQFGRDSVDSVYLAVLWYRDENSWRREIIDGSLGGLGGAGSFTVWDGNQLGSFKLHENRFYLQPGEEVSAHIIRGELYASPIMARDETYFKDKCEVLAPEAIAGRSIRHLSCQPIPGQPFSEVWLDIETGLILKSRVDGSEMEVKSIEYNPTFTDDIFKVASPPGAKLVWSGSKSAPSEYHVAGDVDATITVGNRPGPLAVGFGSVWVGNTFDRTVYRIDPMTNHIVAKIPVSGVNSIAAGEGGVWVGDDESNTVVRIDPETNQVAGSAIKVEGGFPLARVAVGEGAVWVTTDDDVGGLGVSSIYRVDPNTKVVSKIPVQGFPYESAAVGEGSVWVPAIAPAECPDGDGFGWDAIYKIDPKTDQIVASICTTYSFALTKIAVGEGAAWVLVPGCICKPGIVAKIDTKSNKVVANITVGINPSGVAVSGGFVWVVNEGDNTVTKIDPQTNQLVRTITVGGGPLGVGVGESAVWIANNQDGTLARINLLTQLDILKIELNNLKNELAETRTNLSATERQLNELQATLAGTTSTLTFRESELQRVSSVYLPLGVAIPSIIAGVLAVLIIRRKK